MRNKLKILSIGLLLGAFGLASCDDVKFALPEKNQSDPLISLSDSITGNEIQELFEEVVPNNATTAGKVLDVLLYRIAKEHFGEFYGQGGLREVIKSADAIKAFVDAHERFQIVGADGQRKRDDEADNVLDFFMHVYDSIRESFWSAVNNSSYQDRYFFSEKKFYDTQRAAMFDLDEEYGEILEGNPHLSQIIGEADYESAEVYFGDADHNFLDVYQDYIEKALLPDLYRKILVENYLLRYNYSALGRSHARKVQTITLKNLANQADATRNLVTHYCAEILEANVEEIHDLIDEGAGLVGFIGDLDQFKTEHEVEELRDLKFLSRLYQGLTDTEPSAELFAATALYKHSDWASATIDLDEDGIEETTYYPLTTLGDIYKEYAKVSNVRWDAGSSTDFTGGGAYTKETGLMLKQREVIAETKQTEGWFSSSELGSLPSDLKSRLFKIQVANDIDSSGTPDYGVYRQGRYYLTPETYSPSTAHPYLYYDSSSTSWVIVRVDEAVKGSKLSTDPESTTSYNYLASQGLRDGKETQNQIVWKVVGMISGSESYIKAARQEAVENANITYHDQSVYDYFKSNFPDLFD